METVEQEKIIKLNPKIMKIRHDTESYYDAIVKEIKKQIEYGDYKVIPTLSIFNRLIEILGKNSFDENVNSLIDYVLDNKGDFNDFFFCFHKSMRQTDFFDVKFTKRVNKDFNVEKIDGFITNTHKNGDKDIVFGGGHLDMIFWEMISMDNTFYDLMKNILGEE